MIHPIWQKFILLNSPQFYSFKVHRYPRHNGPGECTALVLSPLSPPRGVVIFLHGAGNDNIYPNISLFRCLLRNNFAIFSFNIDGHGKDDTTLLHPERLASCVEDAYIQTRAFFPELPISLVGYSLGGALSLSFLAQYPHRKVEKAVVIATPLSVENLEPAFLNETMSLLRSVLYEQMRLYGIYDLVPAFGILKRMEFPVRFDPEILGKTKKGHFNISQWVFNSLNLEGSLPAVTAPVLLCYGSWDRLAPLTHAQRLLEKLPTAQLVTVPHETHFTTFFAKQTEEAVVSWLIEEQILSAARKPA